MPARGIVSAVAVATLVLTVASPAPAYPRPGSTERVPATPLSNGTSFSGGISDDARHVAFSSHASNLVPGDTNGAEDVFVFDRETGDVQRVSVSSAGVEGDRTATSAAISADGRHVTFYSAATNLVLGDTNGHNDVFVHDRLTGLTRRVSVSSSGAQANERSFNPGITPDGRFVVFESAADNLVANDTNGICATPAIGCDIFVHELATGETERVSTSSSGAQANGTSGGFPSISDDGRYVAFNSHATNLVPDDTNNVADVFVKDRQTGQTTRVSLGTGGVQGDTATFSAAISGDGSFVTFRSSASTMVPADGNRTADVFVHDRSTGSTERVSVSSAGVESNAVSAPFLGISRDGRFVTYQSDASNLVSGDTNAASDAFVYDRVTGITERVSVGAGGAQGDGASSAPKISVDGRYVTFSSNAELADGSNGVTDAFVRDLGPALGVGGLDVATAGSSVSVSGWATFGGALLVDKDDPIDGTAGAASAGGELTGVSLVYRAEDESLLVRLGLASLPGARGFGSAPGVAGAPGVVYGMTLTSSGTRYEVRALRASVTTNPPSAPIFGLFRCAPSCTEVSRLSGGIGVTETEVRFSVPLTSLGISGATTLTGVQAFSGVGEAATGSLAGFDGVVVGDVPVPAPAVSIGIAPAGTPEGEVSFSGAELAGGIFTGAVDVSSLPPGPYEVWARGCLGQACGATSRRISLD